MPCTTCSCHSGLESGGSGTNDINRRNGNKMATTHWLDQREYSGSMKELHEVRFKNTRKEYYLAGDHGRLRKGDVVAVEARQGHDVGTVSLTGRLAWMQWKTKHVGSSIEALRKIYRKASRRDLELYKQATDRENRVMLTSRSIIRKLGLNMKLSDVEFQGDNTKAIFYYIADERVDFRELIRILAREFHIRVEMRQIGARQEAGRVGGIGSCGRELCCSSWKSNFQTITLEAANHQDLPPNVQKLAGQCGKLKCCLSYELDTYLEAKESIPKVLLELHTKQGKAQHQKTDVLSRLMYYTYPDRADSKSIAVSVDRVKEIIAMNKKGIIPETLDDPSRTKNTNADFVQSVESLERFQKKKKMNSRKHRSKPSNSAKVYGKTRVR